EWGDPSGEPLLLVHGFLDLAYSWQAFVVALQARTERALQIIAPDCRGHGESGWVGAGGYYHFPDYVFDLDAVLRAYGIFRCKLIGHSMGGTIAFQYAGTFANRVSKLVLIEGVGPVGMKFSDAPLRMNQWISEVHQRGRKHFREYTSIEAGASQLRQTNPRLNESFALDLARAAMKRNANGKWAWKFDPLHRTAAPQPFYTEQALQYFRRIDCPVLIVEGKESRQTQRADKQERYDAIADQRRIVIENAGHMVHHDNPGRLAEVVAEFLEL
ncbi:MAG TPA: alpha/beta hydrolase, partial [Acidobacteriota bacterium]|nr:alpha/beta hydrolase [Acidobacteriota bacterium]